jgi:hypothetical protein
VQILYEFCSQIHGTLRTNILMHRIRSATDGHSKATSNTPCQCPPDLFQQIGIKGVFIKNSIHDVPECVKNLRVVTDDSLIRRVANR